MRDSLDTELGLGRGCVRCQGFAKEAGADPQSPHASLPMKTHPLLVKLERTMVLTAEERAAVNSVPVRLTSYDRGQEIVRQGDRPTKCIAVTKGLLATSKVSSGGE